LYGRPPSGPGASGAITGEPGVEEAQDERDPNGGDLAHVAQAARRGTRGQQASVHAGQADRVDSRATERRDHEPVGGPRQDHLHDLRHLRRGDPPALALLHPEPEPPRQGAHRLPAAMHDDHGLDHLERRGAGSEPRGPIELVAAQLYDANGEHQAVVSS